MCICSLETEAVRKAMNPADLPIQAVCECQRIAVWQPEGSDPKAGPRKDRKPASCSPASPAKRLSSDAGKWSPSTGGMNSADLARQNGVGVHVRSHAPSVATARRCGWRECEAIRCAGSAAPSLDLRPAGVDPVRFQVRNPTASPARPSTARSRASPPWSGAA
jgi:hypothetical protein